MRTSNRTHILNDLVVAILFVGISSIIWLFVNDYNIARDQGFDPFRYEYFARSDLPEYLVDSSSYTIVFLLKYLYIFLPFYYGFILFITLCLFIVLLRDGGGYLRSLTISPLAFFYIAQTGKDGLAVLAIASIAIISVRNLITSKNIFLYLIIILALIIRPALILFLPLVFIAFKFNYKKTLVLSIAISLIFYISGIKEDSLPLLEGIVSDEGSGAFAKLGREFTFGYSPLPVIGRLIFLFFSPIIQPVASIIKFLNGADHFVLFEGLCQLIFFILIIRHKILIKFLSNSIPFVIVVAAASPFYHFRYMAVLYPVIFTISIISSLKSGCKIHHEIK